MALTGPSKDLKLSKAKQQNIITRLPVSTFIFHIKFIICYELWLTYEGDYSHQGFIQAILMSSERHKIF